MIWWNRKTNFVEFQNEIYRGDNRSFWQWLSTSEHLIEPVWFLNRSLAGNIGLHCSNSLQCTLLAVPGNSQVSVKVSLTNFKEIGYRKQTHSGGYGVSPATKNICFGNSFNAWEKPYKGRYDNYTDICFAFSLVNVYWIITWLVFLTLSSIGYFLQMKTLSKFIIVHQGNTLQKRKMKNFTKRP